MAAAIEIVPYRSALRAGVIELWNECFSEYRHFRPLHRALWDLRLDHARARDDFYPQFMPVALEGGRVIGFAHGGLWPRAVLERLHPESPREQAGYLAAIAVHPAARRRGIGRALLALLRAELEEECGEGTPLYADGRMYNPVYGNFLAPLPPFWGTPEGMALPAGDAGARAFFADAGFREAAEAWSLVIDPALAERAPLVDPAPEVVEDDDYLPELGTSGGRAFAFPNPSHTWVLALDDSQVATLIAYPMHPDSDSDTRWGIYSLEVEAGMRGRGLGAMLLGVALGWCERRGVAEVEVLVIPAESPRALELYERTGFRKAAAWIVLE
ncbi:MAG: GNAT family N-acetyltransferase [Planctomycetes bacterium]|nr:GNAT family N-acetyltransferase [Planctomycetota bacterium]